MKRSILILLFLLLASAAIGNKYILSPNSTHVSDVHYDADLHLMIIHIHGKVLWFTVNEVYGLRVIDDKDIVPQMKRMLGENPQIVHLDIVSQ